MRYRPNWSTTKKAASGIKTSISTQAANNHPLESLQPAEWGNLRGRIELRGRNPGLSLALLDLSAGDVGPGLELLGEFQQIAAKTHHHTEIIDFQNVCVRPGRRPAGLLPEFPGTIIGLEHHRLELVLVPLRAPRRVEHEDLIEPAHQGVTDLHFRAQVGVPPGIALPAQQPLERRLLGGQRSGSRPAQGGS